MPAWSPEIANDFIQLAADRGTHLDQLRLQALVYLAHGWCLAVTGQPLTGDRPEALEHGPSYRRLSAALAPYGLAPVTRTVSMGEVYPGARLSEPLAPARSELDHIESEILTRVLHSYGGFDSVELAAITRRGSTPWRDVYDEGRGRFKDIPHALIGAQFVRLASSTTDVLRSGSDRTIRFERSAWSGGGRL